MEYIYKTPPFKHQEEGLDFAKDKEFFAYFLEQGLGKTKLLIDTVSYKFLDGQIDAVFFIGPISTLDQFITEQLPMHSQIPYKTLLFKKGSSKKFDKEFKEFMDEDSRQEGTLKYLVSNTESFSYDTYLPYYRMFVKNNRTLVIIDESHMIAHIEAQRTQNIIFGMADLTKLGKRVVKATPLAVQRVIMTGTPVANSPYDLYSVFEFLCPNFWGMPFSAFRARYGLEKTDHIPSTGKIFKRKLSLKEMRLIRDASIKGFPPDLIASTYMVSECDVRYLLQNPDVQVPYKNLPELKAKIRPYAFIRKMDECLDLPPKVYEKIYFDMLPEQKKLYKDMIRDLEAEYAGVEMNASNSLVVLIRLSQLASGFMPTGVDSECVPIGKKSPRIEALIELLHGYGTYPVIVASRFTAELHMAKEALEKEFPDLRVEIANGEVKPGPIRDKLIGDFKKGEIDILLGNPQTIGTGFNLQLSSLVVSLASDYSFYKRDQLDGRIRRPGAKGDSCTYVDIMAKDTVDDKIYKVLREKKDLLEYMRGKSFKEFVRGEVD